MRLRLPDRHEFDYQVARDNHQWNDHMLRVQVTASLLAWGRPVTVIDPAAGDGSIVAAAHKLHAIDGVFLSDISKPNFYRLGTELRDQFPNNFRTECLPIEEALAGDDHFDAVVLTEILEHVEDPVAILKLARPKANMLIASSPVFLGDELLDPNPEHLWMFDADGYHEMLVEAGWTEFAFIPLHLAEFAYDFQIWGGTMNILITGAAGFLGSWFASRIINDNAGHDLWQVDIAPKPTSLPMDVQDLGVWLEDFDVDCDLVFHFAAPVGGRQKIEGDPMFNADSLRLDSQLFRWAVKHAKTVVYPSSSAVYGTQLQGSDAHSLHEGMFSPQNPTWLAPDEMYGFTKLAGEMLAWKSAAYGLNTLCLRPFSGYGEGQSFDYPVPSIARRALHQEDPITVWGSGLQSRDFVHVQDIVNITMKRLEEGIDGYQTLNIGSGHSTPFNDIARICAEIVGYEPAIENLTDKPVGVQRRFADIGRMSRYGQPEVFLREGLTRVIDFIRAQEAESAQADQGQGPDSTDPRRLSIGVSG